MGKKASQAKCVWVVGFGVKAPGQHNNKTVKYVDDYALVFDKAGNSAFVKWDELDLKPENVISDAYLFEVLSDLHDNAASSHGLYHLQPASSPEIADFLVQAHITPLLRDLEIIEFGVHQALTRHSVLVPKADTTVDKFFKKQFASVKKVERRIRQEQQALSRTKNQRTGLRHLALTG